MNHRVFKLEMTEAGAECLEVAPRQVDQVGKMLQQWVGSNQWGKHFQNPNVMISPRKTPRKKNGGNPPLFQTQEAGHVWLLKFLGFWASKDFFGMMVGPAI